MKRTRKILHDHTNSFTATGGRSQERTGIKPKALKRWLLLVAIAILTILILGNFAVSLVCACLSVCHHNNVCMCVYVHVYDKLKCS